MTAGQRIATACTQALILLAGVGLLAIVAMTDRQWFDHHVLPHVFQPRDNQVRWWMVERILVGLAGLALIFWLRPWAVRRIRQGRGRDLAIDSALILFAILLSLPVSEFALRKFFWPRDEAWSASEEPLREADAYLGWRTIPSRTGQETFHGRHILYHFDSNGYRVATPMRPVDLSRPSILFFGESIMIAHRLNWPDSLAGRVEEMSGIQSANLSVYGYNTHQMYLQLAAELPRFKQPVAIVALFSPFMLERNLRDDRPHLDQALRWQPRRYHWRLRLLINRDILPFHQRRTIDQDIETTRILLKAMVAKARARHAEPLILVPVLTPEAPVESELRRRVLTGLPYLLVPIDWRWRIPGDGHPDARANLTMAKAILAELKRRQPTLITAP